jgi:hypothetical protein
LTCTTVVSRVPPPVAEQGAFGDHRAAGDAAHRGGDGGVGEVQLGLAQGGLGGLHGGHGDAVVGAGGVVFALADGLLGQQALEAGGFALGLLDAGLGLGELGPGLGDGGLEGRPVDLVERLAGLHRRAFVEHALLEDAADAGADLDFTGAFGLGDGFDAGLDAGRLHLEGGDGQRRHRAARGPAGGCSLPEQAASRRVAERVDRPRPARRVAERTVTVISGGWISDGAWGIVYTNTVVCK